MAAAASLRRASHLALACLSLLLLLVRADTGKHHLVHSRTTTSTSLSTHASLLPASDVPPPAAWPASSHLHLRAKPSASTLPDSSAPRFLDTTAAGPESTALATPRCAVPASPRPFVRGVRTRAATVHAAMPATRGVAAPAKKMTLLDALPRLAAPFFPLQDTASSPRAAPHQRPRGCAAHNGKRAAAVEASMPAPRGATGPPAKMKTLLHALPLLAAAPFLPPPVAALVAFSSLVAPARAYDSSDCSPLTHATCAVYGYDNRSGTIDRRRPDPSLSAACELPLCGHAKRYNRAVLHAQQHGRVDDPLLIFCRVRVLKNPPSSMLPWKKNVWLTLVPVADPAAAAGSGDRVCYVELVHLGYREGYYIRCPSPGHEGGHSSCTAFPEQEGAGEIAAAVWEHRRLNYRDTVWPQLVTPTEKHEEL